MLQIVVLSSLDWGDIRSQAGSGLLGKLEEGRRSVTSAGARGKWPERGKAPWRLCGESYDKKGAIRAPRSEVHDSHLSLLQTLGFTITNSNRVMVKMELYSLRILMIESYT